MKRRLALLLFALCATATAGQPGPRDLSQIGGRMYCTVREGSRAQIVQAIRYTASLWPGDIAGYSVCATGLLSGLRMEADRPGNSAILEQFALSVMEKQKLHPVGIGKDDFCLLIRAETEAASALLVDTAIRFHATGEEKLRRAELVAAFMGELSKEIIPHYQSKPVSANPGGMLIGGPVSPEAAAARRRAMEENRRNADANARQHSLGNALRSLDFALDGHLRETVEAHPNLRERCEAIQKSIAMESLGLKPVRPRLGTSESSR